MFEEADVDGGGSLDRQEVGKLLLRMNPALAAEAMRVDRCGNRPFQPFHIQRISFTKTGSGQS
jgi:hypothetical protein|eukprot:COSAG06_NODE_2735_length_6368_cov_19.977987_6_plen_63_part_00